MLRVFRHAAAARQRRGNTRQDPLCVVTELGHDVLQEGLGALVGDGTVFGDQAGGEADVGLR